jgi:hypothetical protein
VKETAHPTGRSINELLTVEWCETGRKPWPQSNIAPTVDVVDSRFRIVSGRFPSGNLFTSPVHLFWPWVTSPSPPDVESMKSDFFCRKI